MITPNYPRPGEVERGAFVERLVRQWEKAGLEVPVIAPIPRFSFSRETSDAFDDPSVPIAGKPIAYPRYLSLSARRIGPVNLKHWSWRRFVRAAEAHQTEWAVPDAFYGKFLFTGAAAAVLLGKRHGCPAFADLGESTLLAGLSTVERTLAGKILTACAGVVCVSPRLMDDARALGVPEASLLLSPNLADPQRFHPLNRDACRRELGLPPNDFIVVFVGHFIERKGPLRVLEAINLAGGRVKGVFLGRGKQQPIGDRVLYAAPVPNETLPRWLNAADVMVLPTLAEGCCNAIAEALACGLPVISSDIPDVCWQIPPGAGRLVNPNDVAAIAQAIRDCEANLTTTGTPRRGVDIGSDRASTILAWIRQRTIQWSLENS